VLVQILILKGVTLQKPNSCKLFHTDSLDTSKQMISFESYLFSPLRTKKMFMLRSNLANEMA
jgi:hypothetical protein